MLFYKISVMPKYFKIIPFSSDSSALQVLAFYNEGELCNPLGAHVKKTQGGYCFIDIGKH